MNLLFSLTFPTLVKDACLYVRGGSAHGNGWRIPQGETASFDTYFNCFSYAKYRRYTTVERVVLRVKVQGKGVLRLVHTPLTPDTLKAYHRKYLLGETVFDYRKRIASTVTIEDELVAEVPFAVSEPTEIELPIDLSAYDGRGILYPVLIADQDLVLVEGGYYTPQEPTYEPCIGIAICTYRREEFVTQNLERLKAFWTANPALKDKFDVFVVDNARTLPPLDGATLLPNRNLGGSGGFTRGLMEVYSRGYTHALLMDDDIAFDPNILVKTYGLLSYAASPDLSVGGSMLFRDEPYRQHELGALWNDYYVFSLGRDYDVSTKIDVLCNEAKKKPDYSAWWYMCMPTSFVRDNGLPLPLFIKGDDVEYGLRCCHHNIALVNGIGVWHESFEYKYSGELIYYIKRNESIVNALRSTNHSAFAAAKKLVRGMAKELIMQHYATADLSLEAYRDFFKGPEYLLHLDAEALHQALRKDQKQYSKAQLTEMGYDLDRPYFSSDPRPFLQMALTLDGYLLPDRTYDKTELQKGRLIRLSKAVPRDFYKAPMTIQYNHESDRGFVTKLDRSRMWKTIFATFGMAAKVLRRYRKVCRLYWDAQDELTSWETWERMLGVTIPQPQEKPSATD